MTTSQRLQRLARAAEYDKAMRTVDRIIVWAKATGKMDLDGEIRARDNAQRIAGPRDAYIAGRWAPPVAAPPRKDITPNDLVATVVEWEQRQERTG